MEIRQNVFICPRCGAQYLYNEDGNIPDCTCERAFQQIYGDMTPAEKDWVVLAFQETEKPITIQNPLDIYAYPLNRGRREGNIIYFWGRAYDFKKRTVSDILPPDHRILTFLRMAASREARSQFTEPEMRNLCGG